jgi:hypothetical protein
MLTRRGNELLRFFPEIAADLRKLPDIAIDGELVMLDQKGKPEFHELRAAAPYAIRIPLVLRRTVSLRLCLRLMCSSFAERMSESSTASTSERAERDYSRLRTNSGSRA